ncbi:essential recombination ERF family protein [Rhizobium phage RHph_I1_23]|nr:essential recombination ERF family protein [Rhizobium phage RHph_I1_23]
MTIDQPAVPALSESAAIIQVIERAAMNPNVDIDKMERLLEMQERIMARNAKASYAAAFAKMQPDLPEIPEHGKGHNNVSYALWEDINDLIKPVISKHGFGISFQTGREGPNITVTAILTHCEGHSEQTTMILPVDTSGNKNAVQAVGSSTSYGKRYTATALLNLTSRHEDDDGKASGPPVEKVAPPAKSSASLKKRDENGQDAWDRLIGELRADFLDCTSLVKLAKLRADYREKAREQRWPRAWLEALGNEFDTFEDSMEKASRDSYGNSVNDIGDEVPF